MYTDIYNTHTHTHTHIHEQDWSTVSAAAVWGVGVEATLWNDA